MACLLHFQQLGSNLRFHPDEAHFMTFARDAAVKGHWMLPGALDKPPLSIYLSALGMVFLGINADADGVLHLDPLVGEFAGRAPNALLAILTVALLMRLTRQVSRDRAAALLAGLLAALSPYLLSFGATAFSDMSLLFCWALALLAFAARHYGGAGLALALTFWCKPQALLLLPCFALLLLCRRVDRTAYIRLGTALLAALVPLLVWDFARPETSVFTLGAVNNAPESWLAAPDEWLSRLAEWLRLASWLIAVPAMTPLLLGLAAWGWMRRAARLRSSQSARSTLLIYLGYTAAYIGLHTIFAFNHYDRYLLPLLPLALVPLAAQLSALLRHLAHGKLILLTISIALFLTALRLGLPLAGDYGKQFGIDALARHLNQKPVATVIYDPWLGWELGYYLGAWHNKRRVHYPSPDALVAGALELDEIGDRYLVAPVDQPHDRWLAALRAAGFDLELDYARDRYLLYRLTPMNPQYLGLR